MQTLPEWLGWVMAAGAGVIAFAIIEALQQWKAFAAWWEKVPSQFKRYISFVLAAALALGAFGIQVGLGYKETPSTVQAWAETLFAIIVSQVVHAAVRLR